jgi:hypothetical protein
MKTLLLTLFIIWHSVFLNAQNNELCTGDSLIHEIQNATVILSNSITVGVKDVKDTENVKPVPLQGLKAGRALPELTFESISNVMNFKYDSIEGFILNKNFEFCRPYSFALHNSIKSDDGNFIAFMEIYFTGVILTLAKDKTSVDYVVSAYNRFEVSHHY